MRGRDGLKEEGGKIRVRDTFERKGEKEIKMLHEGEEQMETGFLPVSFICLT